MERESQPNRIAQLNDEFRRTTPEISVTPGVLALDSMVWLLQEVRNYNKFSENNPYGEHDFGVVTYGEDKAYWKIDYYNQDYSGWEHPLSPLCRRLLTMLLPEEY